MKTITDVQIEALSTEAAEAGDMVQVALCEAALAGDDEARAKCAAAIVSACGYCGSPVSNDCTVPTKGDEAGWDRLAALHTALCEWVLTRAHRLASPLLCHDADCNVCPRKAERRECVECGAAGVVTDCGHYAQPRPLSAAPELGGRVYCDRCYGKGGAL